MTPEERFALIAAAVPAPAGAARWADLGAGEGAFTFALAERLGPGAHVTAVDRDRRSLRRLEREARSPLRGARVDTLLADFRQPLPLARLDGVLLANALHYVAAREQPALLRALGGALVPGGRLVLVEYDLGSGNPWVPHPVPAARFPALARAGGLEGAVVVAEAASRYWGRAYCGVALRGGPPPGGNVTAPG